LNGFCPGKSTFFCWNRTDSLELEQTAAFSATDTRFKTDSTCFITRSFKEGLTAITGAIS
ncbi:MAG: hypothetical protein KKB00_16385, partial [Gammaproteobacteria bacterium]|nr:hypothetical protein [Gammaproteobacteria bacterium]